MVCFTQIVAVICISIYFCEAQKPLTLDELDKVHVVSCSEDQAVKQKAKECENKLPEKVTGSGKKIKEAVANKMSEDEFKKALCSIGDPIHSKIRQFLNSGQLGRVNFSLEDEKMMYDYHVCLLKI